jgi:aarF domain-containing kinase
VRVARGVGEVVGHNAHLIKRLHPDAVLRAFLARPHPPSATRDAENESDEFSGIDQTATDSQPNRPPLKPASVEGPAPWTPRSPIQPPPPPSPVPPSSPSSKRPSPLDLHPPATTPSLPIQTPPPSTPVKPSGPSTKRSAPLEPPSPAATPESPLQPPLSPSASQPQPIRRSSASVPLVAREWNAKERAVPKSPLARVLNFGALGASLAVGAAAESVRRAVGVSAPQTYSSFISDANAERLASNLSRMRGAALKLGQMLSIQDVEVVPKPLLDALERVRQGADIMPTQQLARVLKDNYSSPHDATEDAWMARLGVLSFDQVPIAAASIGQVHRGVYQPIDKNSPAMDVAFKVQYPGVANSIASDLTNFKRLVSSTGIIPANFFIDDALKAARKEMEGECNYEQEAELQTRYRELILASPDLASDFYVPAVIPSLSTRSILVSEFVDGVPIDRITDPDAKLFIATGLLRLTLHELFGSQNGLMQPDPNFANFLFSANGGPSGRPQIQLVDFGAAVQYPADFLEDYFSLICACAEKDRDTILKQSVKLGFLTGEESTVMNEAHYQASIVVGEPFSDAYKEIGYNFSKTDIPARTAKYGKIMLDNRLTPPPPEAYSLHRRLSGAVLTAMRLNATIDCASMLDQMRVIMAEKRRLTSEEPIVA